MKVPLLSWHNSIRGPIYSLGVKILHLTYGSKVLLINSLFGILEGLSTVIFDLSFNSTSYTTDGEVAIKSIPNSLSILSSTISI